MLLCEKQEVFEKDLLSEDKQEEYITSAIIKDICDKWTEVLKFVEKYHPNKFDVNRAINIMNDNVISYFKETLKRKRIQTTLDTFLTKILGEKETKRQRKTTNEINVEEEYPFQ